MKVTLLVLLSSFFANAIPQLDGVWIGKCRLKTNEAGKVIEKESSLQSQYQFLEGNRVIWDVVKFNDPKCLKTRHTFRNEFKCNKNEICTSIKTMEKWDGMDWVIKKQIDHAGYPNILKLKLVVKKLKTKGKIKLAETSLETENTSYFTLSLKK